MKKIQSLNGSWQWRAEHEETFRAGQVPGSVLCDMLRDGLIEDPFWRDNEQKTRELFSAGYVYQTCFAVDEADRTRDEAVLVFEGLDTLAEIRLNGCLVGQTCDMHRRYTLDVKRFLRDGENHLEVKLHSPLQFIREEDARNDIFYASTGCLPGNAALRKAHYMFGWDWGPQLPDAGIFRPVYLTYADTAELCDVRIRQQHSPGRVALTVDCEARILSEAGPLCAELRLTAPSGETTTAACRLTDARAAFTLPIDQPELWWPNGWGGQPLYGVEVRLCSGEDVLDSYACRIGLRSISLCTGPDAWGSEFAFEVNGQKIFAMGANYIPQDNLIPRITDAQTRTLVKDCARANFNMLRIWGGGYYPDDALYEACDENGILVWQDLMFACNVYALDESGSFEENIAAETRDAVKRLRHHAALALWCGNNEMEWGWGDEWQRIKGHHPRYKRDYLIIFERILADVVKDCDGQTPWWPSSPSSGGAFDKPNDPDHGDQHYWEVWHSGKPFTEYRKSHFRFCSEYGFQSFPSMKTIRSFTLPEDRNIFSRVMESHQKNGTANSKIFAYVADYFLYPKDLAGISYISQILQLKAIQYGVEFWRQNRGRCMGSLYWQLNDCWPVASWSSIDYYGRWKALHYGARRFYAPLMASAKEEQEFGGRIAYYVHNDLRQTKRCRLEVDLLDIDFGLLRHEEAEVSIEALTAKPVLELDFEPLLADPAVRARAFARYRLTEEGREVSRGTTLFVRPKHFAFPKVAYTWSVAEKPDTFEITLGATGFSHYTELDLRDADTVFSDNYFDITDPAGAKITVRKADLPQGATPQWLRDQLVVRGVRDSYQLEEETI